MTWHEQAACIGHDPELWFADGTTGPARKQRAQARAICQACSVRLTCLEQALELEGALPHASRAGLWGGTTPLQRVQMKQLTCQRCKKPRQKNHMYCPTCRAERRAETIAAYDKKRDRSAA